ncbi:hypothetical protein PF005_g9792 [Phytophthora fragariae]|uniref:Uncharacterized protein n=1 Tax=Phytophthora fragariae TaxID=53985 RepID=A0A6A3KWA9_9STRA|nr:hypothetical protein PF003_g20208 [Phytophthora fragariae]KAE8937755.1 hypothetical protein PF009_g12348 [Phytophthora fragariae]KAE9011726.1 hypothetical protein PF011_g9240 [Phytophthora fragariae]KAE9104457.1 hypothetical protein PF010_g13381 [Phytophthora fragariae]KAE9113429.1 hypothetical protein PF007_g10748 [Phytophthora fragariae]
MEQQQPTTSSATSSKWSASQKPGSKRAVPPPTSDDYSSWTVDQLKLECTARKLCVAKNTKKEERVSILTAYDQSKGGVALLLSKQRLGKRSYNGNDLAEARRTRHCVFRLINVLFSHEFFERFISSGDQLTRKELDEGGSRFWEEVAAAFNIANAIYDSLISDDSLFDGIRPDQITVHSAAKLKSMWKEVHAAFAQAEARNKLSGAHADFWNLCKGDKPIIYLHLWCNLRNAGREFCAAGVYEENEDDSTKECSSAQATPQKNRKRHKGQTSEDSISLLAEVLTKLVEAETSTKTELIAEKTALARVQRARIERDDKNERLAAIDGILVRHRRALEVIEEQIHGRNMKGMPIAGLREEK